MAVDTAVAESAQAYLCAFVDYIGLSAAEKLWGRQGEKASNTKAGGVSWAFVTKMKKSELNNKTAEDIYNDRAHLVPNKTSSRIPWATMDNFLGDSKGDGKGWYESSVKIAILLIRDIQKIGPKFPAIGTKGWQAITYGRDDDTMMTINELFTLAKKNTKRLFDSVNKQVKVNAVEKNKEKQQKQLHQTAGLLSEMEKKDPIKYYAYTISNVMFDNINKWSTADIYFTSDAALKLLASYKKSDTLDFPVLNNLIWTEWQKGHLLPVSLKKVDGQPHWKFQNVEEPAGVVKNIQVTKAGGDEGIPMLVLKYTIDSDSYQINWRPRVSLEPVRKLEQTFSPTSKMLIQVQPTGGVPGGQVAPSVIMKHPELINHPEGKKLISILNKYWDEETGTMVTNNLYKSAAIKKLMADVNNMFGERNSKTRERYLKQFKNDKERLDSWKKLNVQEAVNNKFVKPNALNLSNELIAFFSKANTPGKAGEGYRHVVKVLHFFATAQTFNVSSKFVLVK